MRLLDLVRTARVTADKLLGLGCYSVVFLEGKNAVKYTTDLSYAPYTEWARRNLGEMAPEVYAVRHEDDGVVVTMRRYTCTAHELVCAGEAGTAPEHRELLELARKVSRIDAYLWGNGPKPRMSTKRERRFLWACLKVARYAVRNGATADIHVGNVMFDLDAGTVVLVDPIQPRRTIWLESQLGELYRDLVWETSFLGK